MTGLDRWQELREAAAAANTEADWYSATLITGCLVALIGDSARRDAPFIAAASPDVVLSLLGVVDRQARQLAAVEKIAEKKWDDAFGLGSGNPSLVMQAFAADLRAALAGGETNNDH